MKPTDILSDEHRVIEQVIDCLDRMVERCHAEGRLDAAAATDAVDFFRTFADGCHHAKEEAHLFPAMEAKGFSRDDGPTGVMLHEHELGRSHVRGMKAAIEAAAEGEPEAVREFTEHAQEYAALLREHIKKEDHCLFNMANHVLSESDQEGLLATFARVESEEIGEGTHERYLKIANDLADRYGVARAATAQAAHHACNCGH